MAAKQHTGTPPSSRSAGQWIIQILGELLITVGFILLLFVAWQLWWTNISANKAQDQAVDSLIQEFNAAAGGSGTQAAAGDSGDGASSGPSLKPGDWDPTNPATSAAPAYGETFGVVYIPRFGENYMRPTAEGTGTDVLDTLGLGHYEGTAMPGEVGNFALAGHRQTNGAVLDRVEELQEGDHIYVQTKDGYYTYTIYETKIVLPSEVDVIAPNPDDPTGEASQRLLTLTTCHPRYGDTERYIVHAKMENWQPLEAGAPAEIANSVAS